MNDLQIIVLAAGKGTRMPDDVAKMLRPLAGEPLLRHTLRTARALDPRRTILVLGHRAAEIRAAFANEPVEIVLQEEQLGTGHAIMCASDRLAPSAGTLLVLYGDVPLLRANTLRGLLEMHALEDSAATVLSAELDEPDGYGRIVRDEHGHCQKIVEQRDLAPGQERIREVNSGIIAFSTPPLLDALKRLRPDNDQHEYYLTDVISILSAGGQRVRCHLLKDADEMRGVNTLAQLDLAERVLLQRAVGECELCASASLSDREALRLIEGEHVRLQVAPHPFNSGHIVLFPKRHITSLMSLRPEEQQEIDRLLVVAEDLLRRACRWEGLNIGANSGAGEHLAFHLVPRWTGDMNFLPLLAGLRLVPESPIGTWQRLKEAL